MEMDSCAGVCGRKSQGGTEISHAFKIRAFREENSSDKIRQELDQIWKSTFAEL
jgi:hypothetical protein